MTELELEKKWEQLQEFIVVVPVEAGNVVPDSKSYAVRLYIKWPQYLKPEMPTWIASTATIMDGDQWAEILLNAVRALFKEFRKCIKRGFYQTEQLQDAHYLDITGIPFDENTPGHKLAVVTELFVRTKVMIDRTRLDEILGMLPDVDPPGMMMLTDLASGEKKL